MSHIDKIIERVFDKQAIPPGMEIEMGRNRLRALLQEVTEEYRKELSSCAKQLWAQSGNYVANDEVSPTSVYFRNGRVVKIVDGVLVVSSTKIFDEFNALSFAKSAFERQKMKQAIYAAIAAEGK